MGERGVPVWAPWEPKQVSLRQHGGTELTNFVRSHGKLKRSMIGRRKMGRHVTECPESESETWVISAGAGGDAD